MTQRAVVSVSSRCVPGPAPRARDALEGPLLSAASPRATYSRSSSSRPRVAVLTSRRTPPNPPADGRFLPAQRKSPSPRCVACEPGAFGRPSPAATRALSAASSSLARSLETLRRGVDRRQRARRLCAPARPARASRGRSRKFPGEHRTRALVPVGTSQLGRQRGRVFPAAKPNRFACALAFCAAHGDLWAGSRLFSKYAISRTRRSVMRWGF